MRQKKQKLKEKYAQPWSSYEIALVFLLERVLERLLSLNEEGRIVHVIFECRGKKEDEALELAFRRITNNQMNFGYKSPDFAKLKWEPKFVDKKCNSTGLQLADLVARPIGLHRLRPTQPNLAYDVISKKFAFNGEKWFP